MMYLGFLRKSPGLDRKHDFYLPQLREGNVFTSMCHSFCPQVGGRGSASGRSAWGGSCIQGVCLPRGVCIRGVCIQEGGSTSRKGGLHPEGGLDRPPPQLDTGCPRGVSGGVQGVCPGGAHPQTQRQTHTLWTQRQNPPPYELCENIDSA